LVAALLLCFFCAELPGGPDGCPYELVRADKPGRERFGRKIWVKRTLLSDHYLSSHMQGLLRLQAQLVEQAAQLS
jgi:hypothetical protein